MRLLHLSHYFLPESRGGTQTYVGHLALAQRSMGHQVAVITGSPRISESRRIENDQWKGVNVLRILRSSQELFSGDVGSSHILEDVVRAVRNYQPDIVHLHHWHGLSRGIVAALKDDGVTVVVTLHDLYATCMRFFRMPNARELCDSRSTAEDCARCVAADLGGKSLEEITAFARERQGAFQEELRRADLVLCVSQAQKELLESLPAFEFKAATALPIGIPRIEPAVRQRRWSPGEPLELVSWGGVEPRKGLHILLKAMAATGEPGNLVLHLYGAVSSPEYRAELESLASPGRLFLHGSYEDDELPGIASRHDLAVFPFLAFETHALSVDEALHLGMPVLVCDRGAPRERVGSRGQVFAAGDVQDLARHLDMFLSNPLLLEEMRGMPHGARFLDHHAAALNGFYSRLVTS